MATVNGRKTALYQTLKQNLEPQGFSEEEVDLAYTCFVCVYAGAKYMPGQRMIRLIHKLVTLLMRETKDGEHVSRH